MVNIRSTLTSSEVLNQTGSTVLIERLGRKIFCTEYHKLNSQASIVVSGKEHIIKKTPEVMSS